MDFRFIVIQDLLSQVTLQVLCILFAYCQTKQKLLHRTALLPRQKRGNHNKKYYDEKGLLILQQSDLSCSPQCRNAISYARDQYDE